MTRAFRLGLTGSIGMGKTTTAALFADMGIPVWDADAAVRRAYAAGGGAAEAVAALCPSAVADGAVNRDVLRAWVAADPGALSRLETAVHPVIAADRRDFAARADAAGAPLIVFDIPLLFETGLDREMDGTLVVSVPPEIQRDRVLARPGMDEHTLATLLARQMPDAAKRARATWVIETLTPETARANVARVIAEIEDRHA
jgi:dephospho-CoA kinase